MFLFLASFLDKKTHNGLIGFLRSICVKNEVLITYWRVFSQRIFLTLLKISEQYCFFISCQNVLQCRKYWLILFKLSYYPNSEVTKGSRLLFGTSKVYVGTI